jgi:hypothetical protein
MDKFNIIIAFKQLRHFPEGLYVDDVEVGLEVVVFIELVYDRVLGCVVGELETNFSTLKHTTNVFESLINSTFL